METPSQGPNVGFARTLKEKINVKYDRCLLLA